jgi:amino acid permease
MRFNSVLFIALCATSASGFAFASTLKVRSTGSSSVNTIRQRKSNVFLSLDAAATKEVPKVKGGEATIATSTFNLAKSIIGAGVLSLPSGVAFFSDAPMALLPAIAICSVMGLVAGYTFSLIGKACEQHNATSFQEAWAKSVSPKTAWMISGGITAKCFFASLAYSIIIGDSFAALAKTFSLPAMLAQRTNIILLLTSTVLFPLCSLKSLNSLAPFSLLGLGGTLYTAVVMAIRYFDGSYAAGGKFFQSMAVASRPSFSSGSGGLNLKAFVLLSMLSTSYISHYNAPKFFAELKNTSLPRFNKVVGLAFAASIATFCFMMSTGFLTFGGSTLGFVLNNYASGDTLISFARLAIGLALLTGYPFTFSALREGILDLANIKEEEKRSNALRPLTVGLLTVVTGLAIVLRDVGFVVSISGAMFGAALMFVVPAMMNIANMRALAKQKNIALTKGQGVEIAANYGIVGTGVSLGVLGVAISVLRQLKKL